MGQEQSNLIEEDTPPKKLSQRSLSGIAEYIKHGCRGRIVVMTGAGLSTAAGIPDFRSPTTGLYANLARLNLPYAEAVFDISYFRQNPDPFYVLAKELYPGNYSPTISHVFIALLAKKNLLSMLFTQNIDCLERQAGVPADRIVEAHGSFASQRCIECGRSFPDESMKTHVAQGIVPRCTDHKCGGLVKPDIVFFGEQLPAAFHANWSVATTADLVIVMGTSLTVQPFASLPDAGPDDTPRLLFNMARVGSFGTRSDDVLELGDCDSGVRKLADELGWRDELEAEWRRVVGDKEAEKQLQSLPEREAALQDEVENLADQVGFGLRIDDATSHSETTKSDSEEDFTVGWDAVEPTSRLGRVIDSPVVTTATTASPPHGSDITQTGEANSREGEDLVVGRDALKPASLGRVIDGPADQHRPETKNDGASVPEVPAGESTSSADPRSP
ncbi:NAD-dependent deacetylase sirtuin-2 [Cryphonectria parasitica EP155]|uniref:NAD-dependent deacetylase sirtuin-2 n=1 Tax=Cryphonectria parasitica (strain ATCC 38755 / EP155) TaxID=660469 RepID=A0A9P5CRG3_CRYP1|nr:NAD-dependent deacetylase sirtuin-2 [Cryphonectria parasitica EP155]KAF3768544.1 NAD-dependent deacetylase sirtuin-2 [Cryphonectria parasitica EP155]